MSAGVDGRRFAGAVLSLVMLALLPSCADVSDKGRPAPGATLKAPAPPTGPAASKIDNPTQNQLMSLPKRQQAAILAQAIGHGCRGASPYFMGTGDDGSAIWSLRCVRGHTWAVSVNPDPAGSTTAMRCTSFTAKTHLSCFSRF
ncbi:MAG TPA: hypothetical protein VKQ29_12360 [Aliidongia sp.]|nr:hypothetical protein [Aliidongia sp.]